MRIKCGAKTGLIILSAVSFLFTCFTCNCGKAAASVTSEADYIIYKDSGTYWAVSGKQGGTDYSGTDAKTVIQSAINALSTGGKIFIKKDADPYPISDRINLASNLTVASDGAVLQCSIAGKSIFYYSGGTNYSGGITISSLIFDGVSNASGASNGINISSATDIKVEHCTIKNFVNYGLSVANCQRSCTTDNTFTANTVGCIYSSSDGTITENKFESNTGVGIDAAGIGTIIGPADNQRETYLIISNNNCYKTGTSGSGYGIRVGTSFNVVVDSNTSNENGKYGIYVWKSTGNVVISNNTTRKNLRSGIVLAGTAAPSGYICTSILVEGNSSEYNSQRGIELDYTTQSIIANNRVTNNNDGIVEYATDPACDWNIIVNNCVRSNTNQQIQSSGSNTIVQSNYM